MKMDKPPYQHSSCPCGLEPCECEHLSSGIGLALPKAADEKMLGLEAAVNFLDQKVTELKSAQQQLLERYIGLEEQYSALTTLYVACQRLHSTSDRSEVLLTAREIIANLIGCEEYVIFKAGQDGWLTRVDSLGVPPEKYQRLPSDRGQIGQAVHSGDLFVTQGENVDSAPAEESTLTACIPLKLNGKVTGAIALFRLLPQKFELQELDRELFRLLETHLATALRFTELEQSATSKNGVWA